MSSLGALGIITACLYAESNAKFHIRCFSAMSPDYVNSRLVFHQLY